MEGKNTLTRRVVFCALIAGVLWLMPLSVHAATLFLSPDYGEFVVGRPVKIAIRVDTQYLPVNAIEGTLSFDPKLIRVEALTAADTIFDLNVEQPSFSNTTGTIRFAGVILNPGYQGESGILLVATIVPIAPGDGRLSFTAGSVLANDGKGTELYIGSREGVYSFITPLQQSPLPSIKSDKASERIEELFPIVSSPTHPDITAWYSDASPVFRWSIPDGVDGVSYLINEKPSANPGSTSDGLVSSASFIGLPDGVNYFHIKFRKKGVWGPVRHVQFNIDTQQPSEFPITRLDATDATNPRPELSFVATDTGSGIVRAMMRIGSGDWFPVPPVSNEKPFVMPKQAPGEHIVTIRAIDRAGNTVRVSTMIPVYALPAPSIVTYPAHSARNTAVVVSGNADAFAAIRLDAIRQNTLCAQLLYDGDEVFRVTASSDHEGRWKANFGILPDGQYQIIAFELDDRDAISDASDAVSVHIGDTLLQRSCRAASNVENLPGGVRTIVGVVVISGVILGIAWLIGRKKKARKRNEYHGIADTNIQSQVRALQEDIDKQLALLASDEKSHTLSPERKAFRTRLMQYRRLFLLLLEGANSRSRSARKSHRERAERGLDKSKK